MPLDLGASAKYVYNSPCVCYPLYNILLNKILLSGWAGGGMHMAEGGGCPGGGGGMHVHPVHPPWVRHWYQVPYPTEVVGWGLQPSQEGTVDEDLCPRLRITVLPVFA
jgi:hypothetical protein